MRKIILTVLILLISISVSAQHYVDPETLADEDGYFADIDGISIYYIARGDVNNPAVMLIHGFGGSTFTWRDNIDAFVEAGYYVVALDLPPFGLSDKNPDIGYSHEDYAGYVAGLMDTLDIESATIAGHSMGGSVTSYFVLNYPEQVDNLIFVAGGVFDRTQGSRDSEDESETDGNSPLGILGTIDLESESAVNILRLSLVPATFASLIESAYFDSSIMTDEVIAGYARPLQIENWTEGFIAYLLADDAPAITLDEVTNVADMPILIIWGEEDTWVSIAMGHAMNDAFSDVEMVTYAEVGHVPMEENIETFNTDVIRFLDEN